MSVVATAIILGFVVVALIKTRWVRPSGAIVCVVFGIVLASSPVGPPVSDALGQFGSWAYQQLRSI